MPYDTVDDHVVVQRRVRVCARCRRQMPDVVQNRGAYNTVGSVGGSLGSSMGGSMLLGSVLGPVGAIGGAIGGAIVGSRAGAAASDGICNAVEATADDVCEQCKATPYSGGQQNWGGGRLGAPADKAAAAEPAVAASSGPTVGERIGDVANATGESISSGWSWMRSSVSSAFGAGEAAPPPETGAGSSSGKTSVFAAFSGTGHTLGSQVSEPSASRSNPSRLLGSVGGAPASTAAASTARRTQEEEDEALARQLQEQFLLEDRR